MDGNLNDFTQKVKKVSNNVLRNYSPEIRVALGPASITFKANRIKESNEQELSER